MIKFVRPYITLLGHLKFSRYSLRALCASSLLLFGAFFSLFGFVELLPTAPSFIAVCVTLRVICALTVSVLQSASFTAAIGLFPTRKTFAYGLMESAFGLGSVMGPIIGTLLYEYHGAGAPYWTCGFLVCLCGVVNSIAVPNLPFVAEENSWYGQQVLAMFRSPLFCIGSLFVVLNGLLDYVYEPVYSSRLQQMGASLGLLGILFAVPNVGFSATMPLSGMLLDVVGSPETISCVSLFVYFVILMLFGPAPFLKFLPRTVWFSGLAGFLSGVCLAFTYSSAVTCLFHGVRETPTDGDTYTDARVTGVSLSMLSLGNMLGPVLGGAVTERAGFEWAMTLVGFLCLGQMGVFLVYILLSKCNWTMGSQARLFLRREAMKVFRSQDKCETELLSNHARTVKGTSQTK